MEKSLSPLPQTPPKDLLEIVTLGVPADYRFLNVVAASLESIFDRFNELPQKETILYQVKLAVHEACTNIIDHAYGYRDDVCEDTRAWGGCPHIDATLSVFNQPRQIIIHLYDHGTQFEVPTIQTPNPEQEEIQTSGYGLFLIYQLMSEVQYEFQDGQNHWKLIKCF